MIRVALERLGLRDPEHPVELVGQAIGAALNMDPDLASQLSPQSLATLLKLGGLDGQVVELLARAIEIEQQALEADGHTSAAEFRQEQLVAVRSLLSPESPATSSDKN